MSENNDKNVLVVAAIDFGTSNSGYAFALTSECSGSQVGEIYRSKWKGPHGARSNGKVPTTALFYDDLKLRAFGFDAEEQYAKLTESKQHVGWHYFRHFKLKLHGEMQLKKGYEIKDEAGESFPARPVFSESIRFLKDQLIEELQTSKPMTLKKKSDYDDVIKWVITIPAIWNEPAKQFMREAAVEAGIPSERLVFALEPEAAAVFCKSLSYGAFRDTRDEDIISAFKPGGKYMIADLGGGTVDIAVHQVANDGTLTEVIKATGGAWGGTQVDAAFFTYICEKFGTDYVKSYRDSHFSDWLHLENEFEGQKRRLAFNSNPNERIYIKVPARLLIDRKVKVDLQSCEKFSVFIKQLKEFYDVSTKPIIQHMHKILENVGQINLILLVGGFANSDYVFQEIQHELSKERIIRPLMADTTVLEGAVMFGFSPFSVSARVCRYTYGIGIYDYFDEAEHLQEYKIVVDGEIMCDNIFKKIVTEGEVLQIVEKKEITALCSTHTEPESDFSPTEFPFYASTCVSPKYTTDGCCTHIGTITVHAPTKGWPKEVNYRIICYFGRTEFQVKVYNDADDTEFEATYDFLLPKF